MSNAPDYYTPTLQMMDHELIENIERLTKAWITSCDIHELQKLHSYLRGEKDD